MTKYAWEGKNRGGGSVSGEIEAPNEAFVLAQLRREEGDGAGGEACREEGLGVGEAERGPVEAPRRGRLEGRERQTGRHGGDPAPAPAEHRVRFAFELAFRLAACFAARFTLLVDPAFHERFLFE